jgi:phasin family protein
MTVTSDTMSSQADVTAKVYEKTLDELKQSAAKATAGFEQAQASIARNLETSQASASNAILFGHRTWAAYARSMQIWATGVQDIALQSATVARTFFAEANEHLKELSAAKSVQEAVAIQTRILRASAEKSVAEASRVANAYIGLTEEALAPITARVGVAAEAARQAQTSPP